MMWKPLALLCVVLAWGSSHLLADWPQFLGPQGTGVSAEKGLPRTFAAGGPKVLWTAKVSPGFSGAAVHNGQVFILDRKQAAPTGTAANDESTPIPAEDVLRCFDLRTGAETELLSYPAPGAKYRYPGPRSTPAVDDTFVFTVGPMGHVHCVDRKTQRVVWKKHLFDDFQGKWSDGVSQSARLYGDLVLLAPQSRTVGMVALDKATGTVKWRTPALGGMAYTSPQIATIGGVDQVLILNGNGLTSADVQTGKVLWNYNGWKPSVAIPDVTLLGDGRIFMSAGYNAGSAMIKVERQGEGFVVQPVFKLKEPAAEIQNALFVGDHLYFNGNTKSVTDGLVCMDPTGKVLWRTKDRPALDRGNLILIDGLIYLLGNGTLYLIEPDPSGIKILDQAKLLKGEDIWAPMAFSDGKLLVRSQSELKCVQIGQ